MNLQELANRYTDGEPVGGNPLAKLYSKKEIRNLFSEFESVSVVDHVLSLRRVRIHNGNFFIAGPLLLRGE